MAEFAIPLPARNCPLQATLIDKVLELVRPCVYITKVVQRGSFAVGTPDANSDVDLCFTVDGPYDSAVRQVDRLLLEGLTIPFPAWLDSMVPDFGGTGLVYFCPIEDTFIELDVYILASSHVDALPADRCRTLFERTILEGVIEETPNLPSPSLDSSHRVQLVVGMLAIAYMLLKRFRRGDRLIFYADSFLLNSMIKDLLLASAGAVRTEHGWYGLPNALSQTERGRVYLRFLEHIVEVAPAYSRASLHAVLRQLSEWLPDLVGDSGAVTIPTQAFLQYLLNRIDSDLAGASARALPIPLTGPLPANH
jgi:hypothetical protein